MRHLKLVLVFVLFSTFVAGCKSVSLTTSAIDYPPGFKDNDKPAAPPIWDPSPPNSCTVAYIPELISTKWYMLVGGGTVPEGERNYLFYYPKYNQVLSFIDPQIRRDYPRGVLLADYGVVVDFKYDGGFPPGFDTLGGVDTLGGDITYVPGDKWSRVIVSHWPFIKRSNKEFDIVKYCEANKNCYCIRP